MLKSIAGTLVTAIAPREDATEDSPASAYPALDIVQSGIKVPTQSLTTVDIVEGTPVDEHLHRAYISQVNCETSVRDLKSHESVSDKNFVAKSESVMKTFPKKTSWVRALMAVGIDSKEGKCPS
ncbi:hypothetical protein PoB_006587800 [Plakobranchus ocellatus]|uniref:Uncharacterized protein n=1 Tax=Plakobranchus ocellatus TaxID=259542 RepID=A0AAV4D566_9GAST|nr:hypothetical protein PoB_006587800 [Plakobranchus ocellatus]